MKRPGIQACVVLLFTMLFVCIFAEEAVWAASCAKHQEVQEVVPVIRDQRQAVTVPPSVQFHEQPATSSRAWEKGMIGAVIIASFAGIALLKKARQRSAQRMDMPQLTLPYEVGGPFGAMTTT